jgi:hypothetical protein
MAGPKRELWKDRISGKLWVVELARGRVVGCYGPLDPKDIAGLLSLDDLPFERDRSVLRTLSARRDQFVRQGGGEGAA